MFGVDLATFFREIESFVTGPKSWREDLGFRRFRGCALVEVKGHRHKTYETISRNTFIHRNEKTFEFEWILVLVGRSNKDVQSIFINRWYYSQIFDDRNCWEQPLFSKAQVRNKKDWCIFLSSSEIVSLDLTLSCPYIQIQQYHSEKHGPRRCNR